MRDIILFLCLFKYRLFDKEMHLGWGREDVIRPDLEKLLKPCFKSICDKTQPNEVDVGNNHFELDKQMCTTVKI